MNTTIKDLIGIVNSYPQGTNWDEDSRVRGKLRQEGLGHLEVDEARVIIRPSSKHLIPKVKELEIEIIYLCWDLDRN